MKETYQILIAVVVRENQQKPSRDRTASKRWDFIYKTLIHVESNGVIAVTVVD